MIKLIECRNKEFWSGNVFRFPAKWPYEDYVDFMLFLTKDEASPLGLIVSSGYKAGYILWSFPREILSPNQIAIDKNWLIENWKEWIYPGCNIEDVYLLEGYVASKP